MLDVRLPPDHGAEEDEGAAIHALAARLFPICRSITGRGLIETFDILSEHIALERHAVPSGTRLFDWIVPPEWVIRDGYIMGPDGRKHADFQQCNLHVMNYSMPVRRRMPLSELKQHIYTLPDMPQAIPYKTAYYTDAWAFCMAHADLATLEDGEYEVVIDAEKFPGHLYYADYLLPGESEREVLLYTHSCHPSLANDNCAGLALLAHLAERMTDRPHFYSYRFVFAPGTIGSLAWLHDHQYQLDRIAHGLVVACIGDNGRPNYKRSRRGDTVLDRIAACLRCGDDRVAPQLHDFSPYGYDERQFCSPGFNLPVGLLQRSAFGTFPQYHTSLDNLAFIRPRDLRHSLDLIRDAIDALEGNWVPLNLSPKGEPQLGRYGLFSAIGGHKTNSERTMAYLWVLNLGDGAHTLLDIAERSQMEFKEIAAAAAALRQAGLVSNLGFER